VTLCSVTLCSATLCSATLCSVTLCSATLCSVWAGGGQRGTPAGHTPAKQGGMHVVSPEELDNRLLGLIVQGGTSGVIRSELSPLLGVA
jgi:hypothetical protein